MLNLITVPIWRCWFFYKGTLLRLSLFILTIICEINYYFYLNFNFTYEYEFNRIGFHSETHYTERKRVLKPLCNQGVTIRLLKPTISPLVTHYVSDKGLWLLLSQISFFFLFFQKSFDSMAIIYLITANRNVKNVQF